MRLGEEKSMAVDLHIHTVASGDGEFSPQAIIQLAQANQLEAIAITDHDSVASVAAALYWGSQYGIEVIPGCEFSARYHDKWLHILGYFIDYQRTEIQEWCRAIETSRQDNVDLQLAKLHEAGFYLDKDKVLAGGSQPMPVCYSREIFLDQRNDDNPLIQRYRTQENAVIKFCLDWIATGRPYNSPQDLPEVRAVIDLIKTSGGVPVLAHPAATLSIEDDTIVNDLIGFGIVGIEAFTTWHTPVQEEHYHDFCQRVEVIATCGSDFHGKSKPKIHIGQVKNNSYEVVEQLKKFCKH
jgi:predicted metal-dependent phosphoesterase TrpH